MIPQKVYFFCHTLFGIGDYDIYKGKPYNSDLYPDYAVGVDAEVQDYDLVRLEGFDGLITASEHKNV